MSSYTILGKDQLPEMLRDKPNWMKCLVLIACLLAVTCSAVGIGIPIGYTYCYIEHKAGWSKIGSTNATLQILHMPLGESGLRMNGTTINEALMSSMLVSKILRFSRTLLNEEISYFPVNYTKTAVGA